MSPLGIASPGGRAGARSGVVCFYRALGVALPAWSGREASVRCFANRDAHAREDRSPSCSINTQHGAWKCHGCGARGGAYDAALARGHTPRSAIDLMVAHGLTERRRGSGRPPRAVRPPRRRAPALVRAEPPTVACAPIARRLAASDADVERWHHALRQSSDVLRHLERTRGWSPAIVVALELGLDHGRITLPFRNERRELIGVQRYKPHHRRTGEPKALNVPGSALGLFPHPMFDRATDLLVVEGPPDAVAARSRGLTAVAVPGTQSWRAEWASSFIGQRVTVLMDCDPEGRAAAQRIARDLQATAAEVEILDLDPARNDRYDLTDWLLACAEPLVGLPVLRAATTAVPIATKEPAP